MQQQALWHEDIYDAMRALVDALGGAKVVGIMLWPAKPIGEARTRLMHCLDPDHREKLALEEFDMLVQKGREKGCHVVMSYLGGHGYKIETTEPEDERAKLQREVVETGKRMEAIFKQLQRLPGNG